DQQHISIEAVSGNIVAVNGTVLVVGTGRAPVLLKAAEGIDTVLGRMLLPVLVVGPDAIRRAQIVSLEGFEKMVDGGASEQVRVPVPGPVDGAAGHQPP